jgi:hypothetical protein
MTFALIVLGGASSPFLILATLATLYRALARRLIAGPRSPLANKDSFPCACG